MPRRRLGLGTAIALGMLSACAGGGATPLSRADFTDRANTACESLRTASDTLETAEGESVRGEELTKRFASAADGLAAFADELDEPEPPEILADRVRQLVDDVGQYSELLRELGERAKPDQDYQQLQRANPRLVGRLNEIAMRTTSLIQELQFGGCLPRVP